ncbi:MAG: hypothetical protein Q8P67_22360, partial [archaeon]|nr:hypothetical protein [archaeon]
GEEASSPASPTAARLGAAAQSDAQKASVRAKLWAALMEEEKEAEAEKKEAEQLKQKRTIQHSRSPSDTTGSSVKTAFPSSSHLKSKPTPASPSRKSAKQKHPKKSAVSVVITDDPLSPRDKGKLSRSFSVFGVGRSGDRSKDPSSPRAAGSSSPFPDAAALLPVIPDYLVSYVLDDWMRAHSQQRPRPVIKQGWLAKASPRARHFSKRWAVLEEDRLDYYGNFGALDKKGGLLLAGAKEVASASSACEFKIVTPEREYRFLASSPADRMEWISMLNITRKALEQKSEYQAVDPASVRESAGIIVDVEISSLNRKKSIRMSSSLTAREATAFILSKFPDVPYSADLEVFVVKYQKFLSELIGLSANISSIIGNRDRVDLRKRRQS